MKAVSTNSEGLIDARAAALAGSDSRWWGSSLSVCLAFLACLVALLLTTIGCTLPKQAIQLPSQQETIREQLVVHSDFHLPKHHRLLDELTARRDEISMTLGVPKSDEPIHVYLFENGEQFFEFMNREHPGFPSRRAFFVKDDTSLNVYAYWGARVAEDLRHEVTHGYLHSAVPAIPLWLDEGIAEYFEVPRGQQGFNEPHVRHLASKLKQGLWHPDLTKLEAIESPAEFRQTDYAEAWLWIHFLLTGDEQSQLVVRDVLTQLRMTGTSGSLLERVKVRVPDHEVQLLMHLESLADTLDN